MAASTPSAWGNRQTQLTFAQVLRGKAPVSTKKEAQKDDDAGLKKAIEDELDAFNWQSFTHSINKVTVCQVLNAIQAAGKTFFHLEGPKKDAQPPDPRKYSNYEKAAVERRRRKYMSAKPTESWNKTVHLRLTDASVTGQRIVEARLGGKWNPLQEILKSRPVINTELRPGMEGYRQMSEWWDKNGKKFDFLALPGELRNAIYEELVCGPAYPYTWLHKGFMPSWEEDRESKGLLKDSERGPTGTIVRCGKNEFFENGTLRHGYEVLNGVGSPTGLLLANKQVNRELNDILWKSTEFRFNCKKSSLARFTSSISSIHRNALQNMTIHGYPKSMEMVLEDARHALPRFNMSMRLEIRLPHRRKYGHHWDNGTDWDFRSTCWRETIGMMLVGMEDALAHFDTGHVKLAGCISPDVRTKSLQYVGDVKHGRGPKISALQVYRKCGEIGVSTSLCVEEDTRACVDNWCMCQGVPLPEDYDHTAE
ncbi:uncharacterized protein BDZ99DRAFT_475750 [Mytilinidion resinicola]|uniref:Uncharacterized protein n=1 Tax=Mytilinidion resinicola TaxID=574789 RepID=A0A6A6YQR7_9PEZI|nr:uncharacterized protein BDZ99DRAFT_475750 [Mytilinidion resinicola]KAF2810878.1 hypothetical protein BDZ99DRAFT_475750 [Mytilinidion resinicola]